MGGLVGSRRGWVGTGCASAGRSEVAGQGMCAGALVVRKSDQ